MTDHGDEIEQRRRRRTLLAALLATAIGALLIAGFESAWPAIERWALTGDRARERIALLLVGLATLLAAPLLVFAVWLWRLDPRRRPARLGRATRWIAVALTLVIAASLLLLWRLFELLGAVSS